MIDTKIITKLNYMRIIDKNTVLWWELGFEGRRIYSEEEFNKGLEEITLDAGLDLGNRGTVPKGTKRIYQFC